MKKIFLTLVTGMLIIMLSGVFAHPSDFTPEFESFMENLVSQRGISTADITNISHVDFNNLPAEVNIQNLDDTNLGIFQIDFETGPPVYVITMTDLVFEKTVLADREDLKRSYLNFGYAGKMPAAGFLKTSTEVITDLEKGYVMVRAGSITGISTNLDVTKSDLVGGQVNIIIYKNGNPVGFGNTLIATSNGVRTDHDTQSENIITFGAGDVISAYAGNQGNVDWSDVTTLIEITSES